MTLKTPALHHEHSFRLSDFLGKSADAVCWDKSNGGCPFRRFFDLVIASAHNVVLVGLVLAFCGSRHSFFIVADATTMQEIDIYLIVHDKLVRHRRNKRRIGAGTDRKPFVGGPRCRFIQAVINMDYLRARFAYLVKVPHDIGSAHAVFCGTISEHNYEISLFRLIHRRSMHIFVRTSTFYTKLLRFVACVATIHERYNVLEHTRGIITVRRKVTTQRIQ